MKKLTLIITTLLLCNSMQSQVKPDVINSLGSSSQYSGGYLAYSVGEPVIGTAAGTTVMLTQGFLQSWHAIVGGQIALKLFLEGLYAGNALMNQAQGTSGAQFGTDIADNVTIELHDTSAPYSTAYTFQNINIRTNGTLNIINLPGNLSGSYYIVVKHRNSIETWSNAPISFNSQSNTNYDFSIAASQAYGNNQKPMDEVYAIWCADASQDGIVDGTDMALIDNASNPPPLMGYYPEDINGDGIVDGTDMAMIDNNSNPPPAQVKRP